MSATPRLREWFHFKPGLKSFKLIPHEHARYLFGDKDAKLRDKLTTLGPWPVMLVVKRSD